MKAFIAGFVAALVVVLAGAGIYIGTGAFDVRATTTDSGLMGWVLRTARERSIESRMVELEPPGSLDDEEAIALGASHYDAMCAECHAVPGRQSTEIAMGLNPPAPDLAADFIQEDEDAELFWIIKNGLKMTGMPAFGPTHSDSEIWAMLAFVRKLPELDAAGYEEIVGESGHHHDEDMHDEDMHGEDMHHDDDADHAG